MLFLFAVVLLVTLEVVAATSMDEADPVVLGTFGLNGILACAMIVRELLRASVSLKQIHWIFFLAFFVIAPFNQYVFGYRCWDFALFDEQYLETNLLVMLWGILFCLFTNIGMAKNNKRSESCSYREFFESFPHVSRTAAIICLVLSVVALVVFASLVGLENAFSRGTAVFDTDTQANGLLLDKIIRATPVFSFAFIFIHRKQEGGAVPLLLVSFVILLLVDFPTGMARYNMAVVYGGLLILLVPAFLDDRGLFPLLFLAALLFVFPAINAFRANDFSFDTFFVSLSTTVTNLPEGFLAGDYDAYSMLARTLIYIQQNGISWGYQLLGCLLFFIPRLVWTTKPLGSGATIGAAQSQSFTNISCPLPGEGLINFGLLGLVAFAITLALLCRRFDRRLQVPGGWTIFWPFLCFFLFFMMRGDLLSSSAYTMGYLFVFAAELFVVRVLSPEGHPVPAGVSVKYRGSSLGQAEGSFRRPSYAHGSTTREGNRLDGANEVRGL